MLDRRRAHARAVALSAVLALLLAAGDASAARARLALVRPDPQLLHSVQVALGAWDIEVLAVDDAPPGATLPDAERRAEDLSRARHTDAVAWLSVGSGQAVLFVYEGDTHQVSSRVLGVKPPFDPPGAAAVALSLKTLLRASTIAPETERFGATPNAPPPPPPPPPPPLPPATTTAPPPPREETPREEPRERPEPEGSWRPPLARAEVDLGARVLPRETAEPRAGLGLSLWPASFGERLGFGVGFSFGPGASIDTATFSGRLSDLGLSASLRSRIPLGAKVALEPAVGPALHLTTLDGTALVEGLTAHASRADLAATGALALDVRLGQVFLGVVAGAEYFVRWQRYLVEGAPILSPSPLAAHAALRFTVGIL